jgi:hypothetical protein
MHSLTEKITLPIKRHCIRGFSVFYELLIAPKSLSEDDSRREFILNVLLTGTLVMLGIYFSMLLTHRIIDGPDHMGVPVAAFLLIIALFGGLLAISRKGRYIVASHGLIVLYFAAITYGAIRYSADLQMILLSYVLLIIMASVLVSTRYGFWVTLAISRSLSLIWSLRFLAWATTLASESLAGPDGSVPLVESRS